MFQLLITSDKTCQKIARQQEGFCTYRHNFTLFNDLKFVINTHVALLFWPASLYIK